MSELVVLHFARSLNLDPAKLEWAKTWLRETLPFGTAASVLDVTATGALSEWLHEICTHRRIPIVVLASDGVRYEFGSIPRLPAMGVNPEHPDEPIHDYGLLEERPWLDASAPDDLDHRRLCAVRAGVLAAKKARVADWTVWNLLLRDPAFPEVYVPLARHESEHAEESVAGVSAGLDVPYPATMNDMNPPADDEALPPDVGDGGLVLTPTGISARLGAFHDALAAMELPGEAVAIWLRYRAAIAPLSEDDRQAAWKLICDRTNQVGGMKNAQVWLRKGIEVEERRRGEPARPL